MTMGGKRVKDNPSQRQQSVS